MTQTQGTALAVAEHNGNAVAASQAFSPTQLATLKTTLAKTLTNEQFDLFVARCQSTGLDPFNQEIHGINRNGVLQIQLGIDGYRRVAESCDNYGGFLGPQWCATDGVWRDEWLEDAPPAGCRYAVIRTDWANPVWVFCRFKSFYVGTNPKWNSSPEHMLALCAERYAIKKAFGQRVRDAEFRAGVTGDDSRWQPNYTIDAETGEVIEEKAAAPAEREPASPRAPEYSEEQDNARLMRRIHALAAERSLNHDDLRVLSIAAMAKVRPIESMSEMNLYDLQCFAKYLDERTGDALRQRVNMLSGLNPLPKEITPEPAQAEADPFQGEAQETRTEVGYEEVADPAPAVKTKTKKADLQPVRITGEDVVKILALARSVGMDVEDVNRWLDEHGHPGPLAEMPVEMVADLKEWLSSYLPD